MSERSKRGTALAACAVIASMATLTAFSAPLYRIFCQVTGFGGEPRILDEAETAMEATDHVIEVAFNADLDPDLSWSFVPEQRSMQVRIGEPQLVYYRARNMSDEPLVGSATFNVTPAKTGFYFVKTACFCFERQVLRPGEEVRMPVSFFVDPEMLEDFDAKDVRQITLSYTFFRQDPDPGEIAARTDAERSEG